MASVEQHGEDEQRGTGDECGGAESHTSRENVEGTAEHDERAGDEAEHPEPKCRRTTFFRDPAGPMPTRHTVPIDDQDLAVVHHDCDAETWLFFCHGFLSDKTGSYEERCERAVREGYDAVRFDFRGSGESDGAFVDQTLGSRIEDLRAVVRYFDPDSFVFFGSSFGAMVAFHAVGDVATDGLEALVARAPVTYNRSFQAYRSLVEESGELRIDDEHAIDGRFFDDIDRHRFETVASAIDVPVAVFHGTEDESVPLADSLDAVAALETDVLFQRYEGEGHRFSAAAERRMRRQVFDWLSVV